MAVAIVAVAGAGRGSFAMNNTIVISAALWAAIIWAVHWVMLAL